MEMERKRKREEGEKKKPIDIVTTLFQHLLQHCYNIVTALLTSSVLSSLSFSLSFSSRWFDSSSTTDPREKIVTSSFGRPLSLTSALISRPISLFASPYLSPRDVSSPLLIQERSQSGASIASTYAAVVTVWLVLSTREQRVGVALF
jgi:hypothetical protein